MEGTAAERADAGYAAVVAARAERAKRKARKAAERTAEHAAWRDDLLKRREEEAEAERAAAQARFAQWQAWLAAQA